MEASTVFNVLIIIAAAWFLYTRLAPAKGLRHLNDHAFKEELQRESNKIVIDVREPHEYKSGYIPNATNIPLSQLKNRINEIPKDKQLYLYCRSGMRSKQAARLLGKHGFSSMAHLQGGIMAWSGQVRS